MKYEYEAVGPITVVAKMRACDLTVTASESAPLVVVDVQPRRGGDELAAATRVEMTGGRLEIAVPKTVSSLFRSFGSVTVDVVVPVGSSLEIETGSGEVQARGRFGDSDIRSGSGDVVVGDFDQLRMTSGSGDVTVESAETLRVTSGSGDVRIGRSMTRAELRTGSGDVSVQDAADLSVITGSGDASVGSTRGLVSVSSGSGDITVGRADEGEVQAKVASGDVVVGVPHGTAALLDCSSVSGRVTSDLVSGDGPGESEKGVVLRLRAVSGDVLVRRA